METLAKLLKANHRFLNGCWDTLYANIRGFKILASTTNGTSGIGKWQGREIYFYLDHKIDKFVVEQHKG